MHTALSKGANLWNGGEFYGTPDYNSLHILNAYFTKYPEDADKVVLSIKGGLSPEMKLDGSAENVQKCVDYCLKMLDGKKTLDMWECARVDPNVPIETTIGALAKCVQEGKIKGIALSEVKAETIRRAAKVHPIAAVEVELSLWATDPLTNGVASTCAELGIPIVAYSPLGRGFLTGQIQKPEDLAEVYRLRFPRFQGDAFWKNMDLVKEMQKLAEKKKCTPAQLALAWVRQLSGKNGLPTIIPIPGATTESRIEENTKEVELTASEVEEIDDILKSIEIVGGRYGGEQARLLDG